LRRVVNDAHLIHVAIDDRQVLEVVAIHAHARARAAP
jgi:hypothetical protein